MSNPRYLTAATFTARRAVLHPPRARRVLLDPSHRRRRISIQALARRRADGRAKISPVAQGLLDRGLMRLDTEGRLPRLFFAELGLAALRAMMTDRRFADPEKFAHIRQEFGIDPVPRDDIA